MQSTTKKTSLMVFFFPKQKVKALDPQVLKRDHIADVFNGFFSNFPNNYSQNNFRKAYEVE